jgi:glyoxylase-like metal-dependent hydrolase (beta-lactamase superfamily II)
VLSHGHLDHAGGFEGLARLRGRGGLPLTLHPLVWTRRRMALPGRPPWDLPTLRRSSLGSGAPGPRKAPGAATARSTVSGASNGEAQDEVTEAN